MRRKREKGKPVSEVDCLCLLAVDCTAASAKHRPRAADHLVLVPVATEGGEHQRGSAAEACACAQGPQAGRQACTPCECRQPLFGAEGHAPTARECGPSDKQNKRRQM